MEVVNLHLQSLNTSWDAYPDTFHTVFGRNYPDKTINTGYRKKSNKWCKNDIDLTDRQLEIFTIINETPTITYIALAKQLGINDSAVLKHLGNLKKRGSIERIGKTRGYWKVIKN